MTVRGYLQSDKTFGNGYMSALGSRGSKRFGQRLFRTPTQKVVADDWAHCIQYRIAYRTKYTIETAIPTTTTQRSTCGRIQSASSPPTAPPARAPTAITNAADHTTLPEKRKKMAAETLTENAITCLRALSRVSESCATSAAPQGQ